MIDITVTMDIDRPPEEVFEVLADMSRNPEWQKGMQACTWTSAPPLRRGSTYDQHARFLGREIVSSFEVTEFEPGRRIRIVTTSGTMPIDVTREVISRTGGSTVRANVRGGPGGLAGLAAPLIRPLVRASVRRDYRSLKLLLES